MRAVTSESSDSVLNAAPAKVLIRIEHREPHSVFILLSRIDTEIEETQQPMGRLGLAIASKPPRPPPTSPPPP